MDDEFVSKHETKVDSKVNGNMNVGSFRTHPVEEKLSVLKALCNNGINFTEAELQYVAKQNNLDYSNPKNESPIFARAVGRLVSLVYDEILI